jgi:multidrug resistance efflux pump
VGEAKTMAVLNMSRRTVALTGLAALFGYALWLGWPYFHAIVVRDAAVTSWLGITTAPIAGYTTNPLHPGERVGADGRIATITDDRASTSESMEAQAELARAQASVAAQIALIEATKRAIDERAAHAVEFASIFKSDLESAVAGATGNRASLQRQLELNRAEATRLAALNRAGAVSQSELDAANAAVAVVQGQLTEAEAIVDRAQARARAAARGVFLLEDGTDANTPLQNLANARLSLIDAQETLARLRAQEEAARQVFDKVRSVDIRVPPGALVWSLMSSPGAPVLAGSPVTSWVDCTVMLVDAPISDIQAALLRPGSVAEVRFEGEGDVRFGTVLLTRGSAGTLGVHDLAALAKGRREGVAQALIRLEPSETDVEVCAIGRAAHVYFPEVGIIDLLMARLKL